jgi:hypothetical protein
LRAVTTTSVLSSAAGDVCASPANGTNAPAASVQESSVYRVAKSGSLVQ